MLNGCHVVTESSLNNGKNNDSAKSKNILCNVNVGDKLQSQVSFSLGNGTDRDNEDEGIS